MIADSGKLRYLDYLLERLKKEGHRVLIFCQMTKMMNLLEEYLTKRNHSYFRLDGNTSISERNQMVNEFQTNNTIFAFILSTRAGGLGVTLTAADTVIFYDNDWNPTMDAQATDRAHRIGQTKDVTVYRLISRDTVEERIVKRAKKKQSIQNTVYSGEAFKADVFKPHEIADLLFDENEMNQATQIMKKDSTRRRNKKNDIQNEIAPKGDDIIEKEDLLDDEMEIEFRDSDEEINNAESDLDNEM